MGLFAAVKHLFASRASARPAPTEAAADAGSVAGLELAGAHWGERARQQVEQVLPSSWTECPVVIREYMNPLISGQPDVGWLEAVAREHFSVPVARALSLGCGGGGLERHGLQLGIAGSFNAYDVSAAAVALAVRLAQESGQAQQITYAVANLNTIEFDEDQHGAAFASQSMHHILALEHYLLQVRRTLVPGALFVFNEFIGPNQFQWTDTQLEHARRLLAMIPEDLRRMIRDPGIKTTIERPTIDQMNGYDPTEAIRSKDIMAAVERHFTIVSRKDFGGTLLHLVLDNIAGNLSFSDEGVKLLRYFFAEEQRLMAAGEIDSDFTVVVARNDK